MNNSLWSDALYRLSRNRAAMFGGFILILLIIWWATIGENKKNVHGSSLKLKN